MSESNFYKRKKLKQQWKNYTKSLSAQEQGELLVRLYTENIINYKTLSSIFDCSAEDIVQYLKLVNIKRCIQCKELKTFNDFHIAKDKFGGFQSHCKDCAHIKRKNYYNNGPIEQRIKSRQWKDDNRDRVNFVENIRRKQPEVKQKAATYMRNRVNVDMKFKLRLRFSNLLYYHLNNHNISKSGRSWEKIVGYNLQDLIRHLESKFQEGMNWDNYGSVWHIDHKVPDSLFDYSSYYDESFKKCWSLENLQPLFSKDNIRKGNAVSEEWNNVELAQKLLN